MNDEDYMCQAMEVAREAEQRGEVPIGAIILDSKNGEVLSKQGNRTRELKDPTAHAEILAIRQACQNLGSERIPSCDLYVTLEPCTMCAAAIAHARIRRLVIGALDEKGGAVISGVKFFDQQTCHHKKIEIVSGVFKDECSQMLRTFFKQKR